jgi:GT2 family glycosyltransferase
MIYACRDKTKIKVAEKTAVVLLSYNSRKYLEQFLPFVMKTDYPDFRLIIVDNASTDDTQDFLKENYPEVDVLQIDVNRGFTNGFVESLACIEAEYYALLTSDVELTSGWLTPLMEAMKADEKLGACQPKIKSYKDRNYFEYAGACGGMLDTFAYPFCRGRIFDHVEEDKGQYDRETDIFWASGAVFLVRSEVYHRVGGFDNDFFAHMEEIDLCWRIQRAGYRIRVIPRSEVYHVGGSVILYGSREKIYHNYRNNLIMLTKNLPAGRLLWMIPWRILLDLVSGLQALTRGRPGDVGAILKAHWHFWIYLDKWLKKRKEIRTITTYNELKGLYHRSIVWQYFVNKVKLYSDLPGVKSRRGGGEIL